MDERDLTTKSAAWDSCVRSNGRGYQKGWHAACEALAAHFDEQAKIARANQAQLGLDRESELCYDAEAYAYEDCAVTCRRRAGE